MSTKKELLEKKSIKELKQMARDKNLSGYSNRNKSELVKMIEKEYLKNEIEAWPEKIREPVPETTGPIITMGLEGIAMLIVIVLILLAYVLVIP